MHPRFQHDLIADAVTKAQASHAAEIDTQRGELAATERDIARTGAAIDRCLTAFENGTPDPENLAGRRATVKARSQQLRARRDELAAQIDAEPAMPPPARLREVADHIDQVIESGTQGQRKALIEALVAQVKITSPGRIVPVFRIPQPGGEPDPVRAMTNSVGPVVVGPVVVGPVGLEPTLAGS
jgi:site-specific DNA recombinase